MSLAAYAWVDGSNGSSKGACGAAAYVIAHAGNREIIEERCQTFPHTDDYRFTNNDMEMTAVLLCLQSALRVGVTDLRLHSDSEWTVKILIEEYRLRDAKFEPLKEQILGLAGEFDSISIHHVRRELNARADWHCTSATGQKRALARRPSLVWPTVPSS